MIRSKRVRFVLGVGMVWLLGSVPGVCQTQTPPTLQEASLGELQKGAIRASITVSPDRRRFAYVAEQRDIQWVVLDGVEGKHYDGIAQDTPIFSPDSRRVAYIARDGEKRCVVVDGQEGQRYEAIMGLRFRPDSGSVVYLAARGANVFVVTDGQEGKAYKDADPQSLVFSADSKHFVYAAQRGRKWVLVADGVEGKEYDHVFYPVYSPDSKRLTFVGSRNRKLFLVTDGVEGPPYDEIGAGGAHFSPDSQHIAYQIIHAGKWRIIADGIEKGQEHDLVFDLQFSPDSRQLAYVAAHGSRKKDGHYIVTRCSLMVNDVEGKEVTELIVDPLFSPNSKHLAYGTVNTVVVDGVAGKKYDSVSGWTFSPDSQYIVFVARRDKQAILVYDGEELGGYDFFLKGGLPFFEAESRVCAVAVRGSHILRVTVERTRSTPNPL